MNDVDMATLELVTSELLMGIYERRGFLDEDLIALEYQLRQAFAVFTGSEVIPKRLALLSIEITSAFLANLEYYEGHDRDRVNSAFAKLSEIIYDGV